MKNIAITGRMASGKTTLSDLIVSHGRYERVAFAGRLKELAAQVYGGGRPVDKAETYEVTHEETGMTEFLSGREVLQQLGQSVKSLDRDFWIRWLLADVAGRKGPFVLDDLRFPYEAEALRAEGWLIVKLDVPSVVRAQRYAFLYQRPPTDSELSHPSESGVDSIDPSYVVDWQQDPKEAALEILCIAGGYIPGLP